MWDAARVYTIGHAARLTGVPSATIRAWERRYGLVKPVRSEGGYRLYDEQGLQLLRAMGTLVAGGWSASQAAEHLRSDQSDNGDGGAGQDDQGPWDAYLTDEDAVGVDGAAPGDPTATVPESGEDTPSPEDGDAWDVTALARGAAEMDPTAVAEAIDRAFAAGTLEQVVDTWLMPALQMLGTQWRAGRVDVAGEHVVSATLHRRLGAAMDAAPQAPHGPRVAVGLARGSHHELGILAFSVVLRRAGVDVLYLGADLPAQHWVAMVQQHRPAAVVVGVPSATDVLAVRETVAALHAATPTLPVHVGGGAQFEVGQGTVPLGHTVTTAAHDLADTLRKRANA
ncbi:MerR family transcriptional regulator [Pedococcus bigeumensis]|uniref:MerR family transcriptional regulator n=1 Tax=Pedococcus bigeumensis TaxID=433644 RepID=A0A502CV53_9MICO|nr:MerR family transcriptional regulator [Pedococcus bigeumensis]